MTAKGFRSAACRRGHAWTDANTRITTRGSRSCRRCAADRLAARRDAKRAAAPGSAGRAAGPVRLQLGRPPEWMGQALCAQADPDLWFPGKGPASQAKRICAACPVREQCLAYALAGADTWHGLSHGVWGGASETERRRLRRERTAAA